VAGHWEGAFVRLNSIQRVAFDIEASGQTLRARYEIPELGLYDEPVSEIAFDPPSVKVKVLYGRFTLQLHADAGEMTGENPDWGPPVALHLKRVPAEPPLVIKEDVTFRNGAVALSGTLVKPRGSGPFPGVVIVHGSGAQGRSEWRYRSLGDLFARRGIAALVYDKRGVGVSGGELASSFDDLANDAVAAFKLLAQRRDIVRDRIGMMGISQGGWLAPLAASRVSGVSFLVLDQGSAATVEEQELQRVEYGMRADAFSGDDITEAMDYTRAVFRAAYGGGKASDLAASTDRVRGRKWADHVQIVTADADLQGWRLQKFDPAPVLKRTTVPVLALFGDHDTLVPPQENEERMRRYLREAGNKDVTVRVLTSRGHGWFLGQRLHGDRWGWPDAYWIWDKQSPEYLEALFSWVSERTARGKSRT